MPAAAVVGFGATGASAADPQPGDSVWVGAEYTPGTGTPTFPIYLTQPADPDNPGDPDFWAYCIEHDEDARPNAAATVGTVSSFLGSNYFDGNPTVQGNVLWVLSHTIPYITLSDLAAAADIPGLTRDQAINATADAIWRYTDLDFDADWDNWVDGDGGNAEALYHYLIDGANASGGTLTPADLQATVSVTAPATDQTAGTLVGPFVIHTNQATATVSATPAATFTDSSGNPIDTSAVVDGQQVYLDLSGSTAAGSATVTATAKGSSVNGFVVSTPATGTDPATTGNHAQSFILVAPDTATTSADADVTWAAAASPSIGTTLTDDADGDHYVPSAGGTVTDTVAYENLTPDTSYTLSGELYDEATGDATGIVGTSTFTSSASGSGTATVDFTITPAWAGHTLVAFETLASDGSEVASHEDIDDTAQTVYVADLGTTLVDKADGDKQIASTGGAVTDTLTYTNLAPSTSYTVSGELMDKATGTGTGITGSATFTSSATGSGTTTVDFTITSAWAGHSLVAFETISQGGTPVASHEDIDDTAQTVEVKPAPAPTTSTPTDEESPSSPAPTPATPSATTPAPTPAATPTTPLPTGDTAAVNDHSDSAGDAPIGIDAGRAGDGSTRPVAAVVGGSAAGALALALLVIVAVRRRQNARG